MKKMFLFLFLLLMPNLCFAQEAIVEEEQGSEAEAISSDDVEAAISYEFLLMAKKMQPAFERLKTCTPTVNEYIQIYGVKNELCHFKYVNYECQLPMGVAKEYAELSIKFMQSFFNKNYGEDSLENLRIQRILSDSNYCKTN